MQEAAGGQAQSPGAHRQPELLGGQREEEEGRPGRQGLVGGGAVLGGTGLAGGMGLRSVPSRLREAGARVGPLR